MGMIVKKLFIFINMDKQCYNKVTHVIFDLDGLLLGNDTAVY